MKANPERGVSADAVRAALRIRHTERLKKVKRGL
jgi:hypothetical protein